MCWNDAYMIIGLEYQYVGNCHNNETQISSVAMNVGIVDIHTLYLWKYQMLLHIYDTHAASKKFIYTIYMAERN